MSTEIKLDPYEVDSARRQYYSIVTGVESACPEALKDPIVAAAVAQIKLGELALSARLDQLVGDEDEND